MPEIENSDSSEALPSLIFPIGIPGSGKSWWIHNTFKSVNFVIVHPDKIREEVTGNVSDVSQDDMVWKLVKERVSEALEQGKNVILDATNVNGSNRRKFIKELPPCKLKAKLFKITPKRAKKRIREDIENGINRSHVPDPIVDRMYRSFKKESSIKQLRKEGFEIIE